MQKTKPTRITHTGWFFLCNNNLMFYTLSAILTRIFSNSYINVNQKFLTKGGLSSSVVNFYTYFGLTVLSLLILPFFSINLSSELLKFVVVMGILGALGNYYIIKALSIGELSSLAPINSYKPVVALLIGFLYLNEVPSLKAVLGIVLIILGTYFIFAPSKNFNKTAIFYRVLALIFSASEAIFIKKIIIMSGVAQSFILWSIAGFVFSLFFITGKNISTTKPLIKHQLLLVALTAIMQYSTNFVFSKINVSYALALFQLSTLVSVYLGANIFHEKGLRRKLTASIIMIIGAVIIILS